MGTRALGRLSTVVSPRHRRWMKTLQSCTLDPATVEPVPLGAGDVILCGSPRSGTALLAAALFQPPTMITIMEPWDGLRLTPADLFSSLRRELAAGSIERGRLRIDLLQQNGLVAWQRDSVRRYDVEYRPEALLGVKWPSYWQLLGLYPETKFLVCVRDPAEVVTSFERQGGRLAMGLDYDVTFTRALNKRLEASFPDPFRRRIALYDSVYEHALKFFGDANVFAVRYERWAEDSAALLDEISDFLDADVRRTLVKIRAAEGGPSPAEANRIRMLSTTAAQLSYV